MPVVEIPFPCLVYARARPGTEYVFQHYCASTVAKAFPPSLRVRDLREHSPGDNWLRMRRACFIVLVAGDRAQCVHLANATERSRTLFLFHGSRQARPVPRGRPKNEFHEDYVPMAFSSTMASYRAGRLESVVPFENIPLLLPARLKESDVPKWARSIQRCLERAIHASVWVTEHGSFNEGTLAPKRPRPPPDETCPASTSRRLPASEA
jgi:hypothetical protein